MENRLVAAEKAYLSVYSEVADYSEFLQPSGAARNAITEALIASVVSMIVLDIVRASCQEIGKNIVNSIQARIFKDKKIETLETEKVLDILATYLKQISDSDIERSRAKDIVYRKLRTLGFPETNASKLSKSIADAIHGRSA